MSRQLFDDIQKALDTLGFKVRSATINMDPHYPGTYSLNIDAIGPFKTGKVVAGTGLQLPDGVVEVVPAVPAVPVCECGAAKTGGLHSNWCPMYKTQP